jgi:hypothetical protein
MIWPNRIRQIQLSVFPENTKISSSSIVFQLQTALLICSRAYRMACHFDIKSHSMMPKARDHIHNPPYINAFPEPFSDHLENSWPSPEKALFRPVIIELNPRSQETVRSAAFSAL